MYSMGPAYIRKGSEGGTEGRRAQMMRRKEKESERGWGSGVKAPVQTTQKMERR